MITLNLRYTNVTDVSMLGNVTNLDVADDVIMDNFCSLPHLEKNCTNNVR